MDNYNELIQDFERYYCKPSGKLNQSYSMFNKSKTLVFEAKLTKFHLFTACDYDFVNHRATNTIKHKVGKTVSYSTGVGNMSISASHYRLDGEDIWDVFSKNNIKIEADINSLIKPIYHVYMENKLIARIESCGVHLYEFEECNNKIKDLPNGLYFRVDMNPDYIYMVFLVAFTLSRLF